jgi:protein tyrosine/serine phosphatase
MSRKLVGILLLALCFSANGEDPGVYRVNESVYRGKQPRDFVRLREMGIKTVLDLRGGAIHAPKERKQVEAAGMEYVSVGLSGIFPPTKKQMSQILALLQDDSRGPVFVHCRRGADRTGVVIACYRIVHDHWTNEQAIREAREQGFSRAEILMRKYLRNWQ